MIKHESWSIALDRVSVTYPGGLQAIKGISINIQPGEMVGIIGPSGAGKSTLIRTVNGLNPVSAGQVSVGPHQIDSLRGRALRKARGDIGMIFQSFNLADRISVMDNVFVGRFAHTPVWRSVLGIHTQEDKELAMRALDSVNIADKAGTLAGALSGGQKQRVAIARALAQQPKILLADEPIASLDPPTAHTVMRDIQRINREQGITVVVNLHQLDMVQKYTDRVIGVRAGEIVFDGATESAQQADFEAIYDRPIMAEDVAEQDAL
ncbi:phosphonate ABC transporter ATP-binding protein [Corynebacterium stationis]|uniref:phosphonate ABC transporter ATP-binding protein n=1 Tax=Corynebacterium stationis TaxID=1705 RepID=UPI00262A179B|nr:phosphonate ABC transporter ATP-binding protein [Corynebacterium stationis]